MLFLQTQLNQPAVGEDEDKSIPSPASSVSPVPQVTISPVTPSTPSSHGDGMDEDELEAVISVAEQMTADLQQQQITEERAATTTSQHRGMPSFFSHRTNTIFRWTDMDDQAPIWNYIKSVFGLFETVKETIRMPLLPTLYNILPIPAWSANTEAVELRV